MYRTFESVVQLRESDLNCGYAIDEWRIKEMVIDPAWQLVDNLKYLECKDLKLKDITGGLVGDDFMRNRQTYRVRVEGNVHTKPHLKGTRRRVSLQPITRKRI